MSGAASQTPVCEKGRADRREAGPPFFKVWITSTGICCGIPSMPLSPAPAAFRCSKKETDDRQFESDCGRLSPPRAQAIPPKHDIGRGGVSRVPAAHELEELGKGPSVGPPRFLRDRLVDVGLRGYANLTPDRPRPSPGHCRAGVAPKVSKFRQRFGGRRRSSAAATQQIDKASRRRAAHRTAGTALASGACPAPFLNSTPTPRPPEKFSGGRRVCASSPRGRRARREGYCLWGRV